MSASENDCDLWVVEPMAWMATVLEEHARQGPVLCPKCNAEIGCFSWFGEQCSCGARLQPAFQIKKDKLLLRDV